MDKTVKTVIFWLVIVVSAALLWQVVRKAPGPDLREISYSDFLSRAESGSVAKVTITRSEIVGQSQDGSRFRLVPPPCQDAMLQLLHEKNVEIWFRDASNASLPAQLAGTWAPLILLAALWFFMIRSMQKAQARMQSKEH